MTGKVDALTHCARVAIPRYTVCARRAFSNPVFFPDQQGMAKRMSMAKPDIDLLQARMADIKARVRNAEEVLAFFRGRPATAVAFFFFCCCFVGAKMDGREL